MPPTTVPAKVVIPMIFSPLVPAAALVAALTFWALRTLFGWAALFG